MNYLLNIKLASQQRTVAIHPNNILFSLTLSNTDGNTTVARATNPASEKMSDNLSICSLFNPNKGLMEMEYTIRFFGIFNAGNAFRPIVAESTQNPYNINMQNSELIKYGPDVRYQCQFGYGDYTLVPMWWLIPTEGIQQRALRAGWVHGCPQALALIESNPEAMFRRYTEVNTWFTVLKNLSYKVKSPAYDLFTHPRTRLSGEEVGKHDPLCVPRSHLWRIAPMTAIEGYASPRVILESETDRFELARLALERTGEKPWEFLAVLSENAALLGGVEPEKVLHHVYAKGLLEEERCFVAYYKLAQTLETKAPTVWRALVNLPKSQREELAIAEIPILV